MTRAFVVEGLDPTSLQLARELLRSNSRLASHARREYSPGGGEYFVLEMPPPSGEHPALVVDAGDRERVSVRLGAFSAEFDAPARGGRSSSLPEAVSLVEDLLAGNVRLWVAKRNGAWVGCGVVASESELRSVLARTPRGTEVTVQEWDLPPAVVVAGD